MRFYKIIDGNSFIGIGSSLSFRRYQTKHKILLCCDETEGEYIDYKEKLYRDSWLAPRKTNDIPFMSADIIEIDFDEYKALYDAIERDEEIIHEQTQDEDYEEPPVIEYDDGITIEAAKEMKNTEMNYTCHKIIEAGFDITLSDGETHHFSLTTQDQLNLITLSSMVASGADQVPYHADGELCQYYSAADIQLIVNTATALKTYHTTYVNALKMYVRSLDTIESILSIEYGVDLPEEFQSDVLKNIIHDIGG